MSKTIAGLATVGVIALIGGTFAVTLLGGAANHCGVRLMDQAVNERLFELVGETGETVTHKDVITKPTLIYFGYTFCPDVCPLDTARNAAAIDILAERGVDAVPIFITIDPARDTVEVVRDYADSFHPDMIALTGSDEQIEAVARAYDVQYTRSDDDPDYYLMEHSTLTYLAIPKGDVVTSFRRSASPEAVAATTACIVETV